MRNGHFVGSELFAQNSSEPQYFHPWPSVAGKDGYDATSSSGSNLGPTSQALVDCLTAAVRDLRAAPPKAPIPMWSLVSRYTEGRQLGILGEPRVNMLTLNLVLDAQR